MAERRRAPATGEEISRDRSIGFTFDGRRYEAFEGDTVASALAAAGVSIFSRSFKYHRPRGLLCCAGRCPNCMVEVDGVPNVRACVERVRDGSAVRGQNAWPSVRHDMLEVFDRLDRLLPVGFYYKTFIHPRWMWPVYEGVLRRLAGLGRVDGGARPELHPRKHHLHCDVAVIGGGPAGSLAALEASSAGARVVFIDDQPRLGGHLRLQAAPVAGDARIQGLPGFDAAARLESLVHASSAIEYLPGTSAFGLYEGNLVGASRGHDLIRVRARQIIVATGAAEGPILFDDNDRPGVMLGSAALRLARLYGVAPGDRVVVVTDDDHGWATADELLQVGVGLAAVVDSRSFDPPPALAQRVRTAGAAVFTGASVVAVTGRTNVGGVVIRSERTRRSIGCDLVAMAGRPEPVISLLAQHGVIARYDDEIGAFVPGLLPEGVHAAGHVEGIRDEAAVVARGVAVGRDAAKAALRQIEDAAPVRQAPPSASEPVRSPSNEGAQDAAFEPAATRSAGSDNRSPHRGPTGIRARAAPLESSVQTGRKTFVCVCEDVTVKDLGQAVREGFDSLETLKRYSTVTMGPCQGKMCHGLSARLHAALTHQSPAATGLTTARPPFQPVPLAALAGPQLAPVRQTPMHDRHMSLGATWMDMGEWKRPLFYKSVEEECRAVREAAGAIDVSTLGKLEISGRDAGEFLDWLHPNRFSDLPVGRVRYRAMCDDAGIVLDDGTVARLGPDRFFLTTGTGTLDAVDQWLRWWLAGTNLDVQVVNVTSEYAAINLAGPRAREVMARLTAMDVSQRGMPYLAAIPGIVAGVPAIILRIGFVGELGYEIHVPADYGAHLWDAVFEAGREFGIAPFGVEAQRVLRLEKQHLIPGQDTDALSNPLEAGLDWMIKADKPDFIGRDALAVVAANGRRNVLVGFEVTGDGVPAEGAAIVRDGHAIGRVTSCKWSPTLRRAIGLAWVRAQDSTEGAALTIRLGTGTDGASTPGKVQLRPFYDPDGVRLRS